MCIIGDYLLESWSDRKPEDQRYLTATLFISVDHGCYCYILLHTNSWNFSIHERLLLNAYHILHVWKVSAKNTATRIKRVQLQ
jgi:hypothetical protein